MWAKILLCTAVAVLTVSLTFVGTFRLRFAYLAHAFPHDGQIGLDAMVVAGLTSIACGLLAVVTVVIVMGARR
jgi:hypothetical protein